MEKPTDIMSNPAVLEVVEGLLKMCMDREKQINDLNRIVEGLQAKLSQVTVEKNASKENIKGVPSGHGIVIVDESQALQRNLSLLLKPYGFEIVGTTSEYKQAVNLVRTLKPSLVMIDFTLPDMEGLLTSQKIKHEFPETRIIIMSTQLEEQTILWAIQYGADEYISKPVTLFGCCKCWNR